MLVFRRITSADFFNIYKPPGAEERGGGQSYIDIDTSGVSLSEWRKFFAGISPQAKKGGPLWQFEITSLGLGTSQRLKIGQRRSTSVSIREQKLSSRRSNRVHAWNPDKSSFPRPSGALHSSSDAQIDRLIEGLVIFIIRATDDTYWAGWMRAKDRPKGWSVPSALEVMFSQGDGFVEFGSPLAFDEHNMNWPFYLSGGPANAHTPPLGPARTRSNPAHKTPVARKRAEFRELSEEELASNLFDSDYSASPPARKEVVARVRKRNQKAARALKDLYGECQISGPKFVFNKVDGKPYLEVHHLIPLGMGGADEPANLVVLSAHMHRMLHHANVSDIDLSKISNNKLKIQINDEDYVITWRPDHAATITRK